ncbi:MAG: hypothetical protein QNJ91_00635 [Gammaproteobacteria bacterium]|nr:hypothetical protein [Gammaproteobacteria bacterium]
MQDDDLAARVRHLFGDDRLPVADPALEPSLGAADRVALRNGCLHTQPSLRRTTFRHQ